MQHIRVSCNEAQYKRGWEELLIREGLYAAWLGDAANGLPGDEDQCVRARFGERDVDLHRRAYSAYKRIHVGDRLVMAGVTGFYVGRVMGIEEEIVADCTAVGSSVRARIHGYARKCQQRNMAERASLAVAAGRAPEVYEVRMRVAWEKIEPTAEQLAWATGVQGIFVHRSVPFPAAAPPAVAVEELAAGGAGGLLGAHAVGAELDPPEEMPPLEEVPPPAHEADREALEEIARLRAALAAAETELSTLRRFRATVAAALPA